MPDEVNRFLTQMDEYAKQPGAEAGPTKTVEQIVQDTEGPKLDEITLPAGNLPSLKTQDGKTDFALIYKQAHLPDSPFTAEQMLDMLNSLPQELPLDTKRQTVKVTLTSMGKTLGVTPETIVADASRKLSALNAYVEQLTKQTTEFVSSAEKEIADLLARIEEKRSAILAAKNQQSESTKLCSAESDRLDDVLEFFSLDVAPSKYAPDAKPDQKQ
jgi:hypothetical protein